MGDAMEANRDYYEVLGVDKQASQDEIRRAFDQLFKAFQAAGKPQNIDEVEEIRAIATAYRVLSDPEKRSRYDRLGQASIGDPDNSLARAEDRLDELFQWLGERRRQRRRHAADFVW
jgi:molecular chaperone DnaJ